MNKNFSIKDAVFFELFGETLDARELISLVFNPSNTDMIEMLWKVNGSNRQLKILFSEVQDFSIKGRDQDYSQQSGKMLAIAGFTDGKLNDAEPELYVEPTVEMNYLTFVMHDALTIFVKAENASMKWV